MQLQEPYAPRPIRSLGLWEYSGWRMKVYSIAYQSDVARPTLVKAAKAIA